MNKILLDICGLVYTNKLRLLLIACIITLLNIKASATERTIGYCPDEISSNVYPVGVKGQSVYLSAAVKFPSSMMEGLKGNKLTKIRIGIGAGLTNTRVWVRVGSLDSTPVILQSAGNTTEGWNEITLDSPYEIDGSEIYVGYSGRQPSDAYCIWFDGEDNPNAMFINDGSWADYYGKGWGSLLIQGIVSGDNFADDDLAVESAILDSTYYRSGSKATANITLSNQGKNDVESLSYSYQIDDAEPVSETVSGSLPSSERVSLSKEIDLAGVAEGVHTLKIFLNKDDASKDEISSNDTISRQLLVYTNQYKRNILLEHFTTIPCVNCPYGNNVLNYATKDRDDIVWVAHHVGFRRDELTITDSYYYLDFGVNSAPMSMLDRRAIPGYTEIPPFGIGYTNTAQGGNIVKAMMDYCASIPAFTEVESKCEFDESSRKLTVNVSGECNGIFRTLTPETRLTIFITENNVEAKAVQTGTTNERTHQHVIRKVLTEAFGNEIEWNGNKFEYSTETVLEDTLKAADIKAVAFISKPFNSSDVNDAEVLNACESSITGLTAIKSLDAEGCNVSIKDGSVTVSGPYDTVKVYNANGTETGKANLTRGLYIVKVTSGGRTTTKKLIY